MAGGTVFVGDALTGAGWRLAGATTLVPSPGEEETFFRQALRQGELVIVTAQTAQRLPRKLLEAAAVAQSPQVLIAPDAAGGAAPQDLAAALRSQMGLGG
ncbi:MAG: Vacuolar H+transporting two-sector ATPase F subunit [Magnetococcales bacterium]|nr:Vacuolar H+transporting two-sector ATPase F subunit [Magnetococcales bacterium]